MFRQFTLTLTATPTSIFDLLVAGSYCDSLGNMLVSNVKNGAIIPDRCMMLDVFPSMSNTGLVTLTDNSGSGSTSLTLSNMSKRSNRNTICLRDYLFADTTANDAIVVQVEYS